MPGLGPMAHLHIAAGSALLVTALFLAPPASAAVVVDQVRNGSFESWNAAGTVPDHWTVEVGNVAQSTFATNGSFAAQLRAKPNQVGAHASILSYAVPEHPLPDAPAGAEDAPIVPGQFYQFSFDAAGVYRHKGAGNATVSWYGLATGALLRVDTINVPDGTAYARFEAHLQAPADPTQGDVAGRAVLRFLVIGQSSDSDVNLWVDDVHFGPSTPIALPL